MSAPTTSIGFSPTTPAPDNGYQNVIPRGDGGTPLMRESFEVPNTGGVNAQTSSYTAVAADCGKIIVFNSSSAVTLTLPSAVPFAQWEIGVENIGTGVLTVTPGGSTHIDGAGTSLTLAQNTGVQIQTDGSNYFSLRGAAAGGGGVGSGALLNIRVITATGSGTYTPTTGTSSIVLEMVGGGGGSAGAAAAEGSQIVLGGSGGGGGYVRKRLTANFSGASYSVGAGGTGGLSGNNAGGNGGSTTFTTTGGSPVTYTAGGGLGGFAGSSLAAPIIAGGNTGGTATNGDINITGGPSCYGFAGNTFSAITGAGGASQLGQGGLGAFIPNASHLAGWPGLNYGGGASGAGSSNGGGAAAGGAGGNGILIIYEYS